METYWDLSDDARLHWQHPMRIYWPAGWRHLVEHVCAVAERELAAGDYRPRGGYTMRSARVACGVLRLRSLGTSRRLIGAARAAGGESQRTCARCGQPGQQRGLWEHATCDEHPDHVLDLRPVSTFHAERGDKSTRG